VTVLLISLPPAAKRCVKKKCDSYLSHAQTYEEGESCRLLLLAFAILSLITPIEAGTLKCGQMVVKLSEYLALRQTADKATVEIADPKIQSFNIDLFPDWNRFQASSSEKNDNRGAVASIIWRYPKENPALVFIESRIVAPGKRKNGIGTQITAKVLSIQENETGVPIEVLVSDFDKDNMAAFRTAYQAQDQKIPEESRLLEAAKSTAAYKTGRTLGFTTEAVVRQTKLGGYRLILTKKKLGAEKMDSFFNFH
jgi:hypothetical protein